MTRAKKRKKKKNTNCSVSDDIFNLTGDIYLEYIYSYTEVIYIVFLLVSRNPPNMGNQPSHDDNNDDSNVPRDLPPQQEDRNAVLSSSSSSSSGATTTTTTTTIKNLPPTKSITLVWPRIRNWPAGYVLGWKVTTADREMIICAGVVVSSTKRTLAEYRQRLIQLRTLASGSTRTTTTTTITNQKTSSQQCCTCLLDTLDIIAYWDPQDEEKGKTTHPDTNGLLQIRWMENGHHPWLRTAESNAAASSKRTDTDQRPTDPPQQQLMYYYLDDQRQDEKFVHFCTEYDGSKKEWSTLIDQINSSPWLLDVIQTGNLPSLPEALIHAQTKNPTDLESKATNTNMQQSRQQVHPQTKEAAFEGWKKIPKFLLSQSFTIQHFQQVCYNNGHTPSLMAILSPFRCFQEANFHFRESRALTFCRECGKPELIPSRIKGAKREIVFADLILAVFLDLVLGLFFGVFLCSLWPPILVPNYLAMKHALFETLQHQISWLETFPAGFKLNVPLTTNMGHEIRTLFQFHRWLLESTLWNPPFLEFILLPILGIICIALGYTTTLAVMIDIWRLEIFPVIMLAVCFRSLYTAELYLLSALWRLFRGKKWNVLRNRTDSMHYDAMQLLVGTIGFCICVFLFTTIFVYSTFFMAWNIGLQLPLIVLWVNYMTTRSMPWGSIWWRSQMPGWFSKHAYLHDITTTTTTTKTSKEPGDCAVVVVVVTQLETISESLGSVVVKAMTPHMNRFLPWLKTFVLGILYPQQGLSPCSMPFEYFLNGWCRTNPIADDGDDITATTKNGKHD